MERTPIVPAVFFGTTRFDVRYDPDLADEGSLGSVSLLKNVILLRPGMSPAIELQTLWHEILHVGLFLGGVRKHDELQLEILARTVVQVSEQNPELSQ